MAATAFFPFSSRERTTRPVQLTRTSVSVPRTIAGNTMRNRITVPTSREALVWKSTPPDEISAVSAKCSRASLVRTVSGSFSGKRTELRVCFTRLHLLSSVYSIVLKTAKDYFGLFAAPKDMRFGAALELGHLSEIKSLNFHRRHHHIEGFFSAGADGVAHGFHVAEKLDQALVEAKVAYALLHLAVLHQECAVARHAGEDLLVRIDLADVPQPCDQNALLGSCDHLLDSLLAAGGNENDVGGSL